MVAKSCQLLLTKHFALFFPFLLYFSFLFLKKKIIEKQLRVAEDCYLAGCWQRVFRPSNENARVFFCKYDRDNSKEDIQHKTDLEKYVCQGISRKRNFGFFTAKLFELWLDHTNIRQAFTLF